MSKKILRKDYKVQLTETNLGWTTEYKISYLVEPTLDKIEEVELYKILVYDYSNAEVMAITFYDGLIEGLKLKDRYDNDVLSAALKVRQWK